MDFYFLEVLTFQNQLHILHQKDPTYFLLCKGVNDCNIIDLNSLEEQISKLDDKLILVSNLVDLKILNLKIDWNKNLFVDYNLVLWMFYKKTTSDFYSRESHLLNFYDQNKLVIPQSIYQEKFDFLINELDLLSLIKDFFLDKNMWYNNLVLDVFSFLNRQIQYVKTDIIKNKDLVRKLVLLGLIKDNLALIPNNLNYQSKTLRPTNNIYGFNFFSLSTEDKSGVLLTEGVNYFYIDFKSFHLQLIAKILGLELDSNYKSWHEYFYDKFFKSDFKDFHKFKSFVFYLLYGDQKDKNLQKIEFFDKLAQLKDYVFKLFLDNKFEYQSGLYSYLKTKNIVNYFPYDEELFHSRTKVFNYFLQLTEVDYMFRILKELISKYQINLKFYHYDSFIFEAQTKEQLENAVRFLRYEKGLHFEIGILKGNFGNVSNLKVI